MTEVYLNLPDGFALACQVQQQQADNGQKQFQMSAALRGTSRRVIQKGETFLPVGTSQADLENLFSKREP